MKPTTTMRTSIIQASTDADIIAARNWHYITNCLPINGREIDNYIQNNCEFSKDVELLKDRYNLTYADLSEVLRHTNMTFELFVKSRRYVENIGLWIHDDQHLDESGYIYDNSFYIMKTDSGYYMMIIQDEYENKDIKPLELILFNEFAKFEYQ